MKNVAVGIGCDRGCDPAAVEQAALAALVRAGIAPDAVFSIASIDIKSDEPAITGLAAAWRVPAQFFAAGILEKETPRLLTPSELVFAHTGCHGVAEAAALAAVGEGGVLVVPKIKGQGVTVAVARRA